MTDMYDSECDEEYDEYYNNRHQRRLSDPSSNLNNYSKNGWRTKTPSNNTKALSQNALDSLGNEMSEIEAGDLRDGKYIRCMLHFLSFACSLITLIFGQMVMVVINKKVAGRLNNVEFWFLSVRSIGITRIND